MRRRSCAMPGRLAAIATGVLLAQPVCLHAVQDARAEPLDQPWTGKPDYTARQVTTILFNARSGDKPDLSRRDLTYLDLAGLDFKGASLEASDLYGADLTGATLAGAKLTRSRLDRAVLIRADLSGANLSDATILRPTVYSDQTYRRAALLGRQSFAYPRAGGPVWRGLPRRRSHGGAF